MKTYKLSYDLTMTNEQELARIFHQYDISTGPVITLVKEFVFSGDDRKLLTRDDIKPSTHATPYDLGLSTYGWQFNHYGDSKHTYNIWMGANPFANGLLGDTSQGCRGQGYCSYIEIETTDKEFAKAFNELIVNSNCKEVFDNSSIGA